MQYLIAVLSDRIQAEAAYTALEKASVPLAQVSLLGRGYKSADEFGFINPNQPAQAQARQLMVRLSPLGFVLGVTFDLITNQPLISGVNPWVSHGFGGCLGALFGGLGGLFVGGGVGLVSGGGDALIYRNRLNAGKYLIVVQGTAALIQQATELVRPFEPELMQGYVEPER